jgi:HSP20 family molecular chaperone IbpA
VFLFQTQCDSREFFRYILSELGIKTPRMGLVSMHKRLNEVLFSEMLAGRRFVIIVDEAQDLDGPVLETIRLLSDFETPHAKLLEIVLAGQPQLAEKLAEPSLSQLRQRIAIVRRLEPLSAQETACYIEHRLKVAGYSGGLLFAPDALALITAQSQGIPREINNICFNALSLGEARGCQVISGEIAQEVLANITVDSIMPQSRAQGSPAPAIPLRTSPLKLFPDDRIFELTQEINDSIARRAYELFESSGFTHGHAREDWLRAESEILLKVPVDVMEAEKELTVRADVPGFGENDLEVRIAPRSLCITGRRQGASDEKEGRIVYSERRSKQIFRLVDLPAEVDPDGVNATLTDGLLEIKVSKARVGEEDRGIVRAATA